MTQQIVTPPIVLPTAPEVPTPAPRDRDDAVASTHVLPAELDRQVATARAYPRDVRRALAEAVAMATVSPETAAACIYTLARSERGGAVQPIRGPSVRLAEILATAWGNMRCEVISDDIVGTGRRTMAQAVAAAWDLEKNLAVRVVARRRAVDRNGVPYGPDMMAVTLAACASIAYRNAIFRVIPRAYVQHVYHAAESVATGATAREPIADQRARAIEYFRTHYGVSPERILAAIGRRTVEEITGDDLARLRALAEEIRRGEHTVDDCFPQAPTSSSAPDVISSASASPSPASPATGPESIREVLTSVRRRTSRRQTDHPQVPVQAPAPIDAPTGLVAEDLL